MSDFPCLVLLVIRVISIYRRRFVIIFVSMTLVLMRVIASLIVRDLPSPPEPRWEFYTATAAGKHHHRRRLHTDRAVQTIFPLPASHIRAHF